MHSKRNESNSINHTYFSCGKLGHIKVDCSNNQIKEKYVSKKNERNKGKETYISWEDNDMSSSSDTSIKNKSKLTLYGQ